VQERTALIAEAAKIAPEIPTKGRPNDEIKAAVLDAAGIDTTDRAPAYIDARFDALADAARPTRADPVGASLAQPSTGARTTYITQLTSAWKGTPQ